MAEVLNANFVQQHYGRRVITIPDKSSYDGYREMEDFIPSVENNQLRDQLQDAIQGRGAFGRFRSILGQHLAEKSAGTPFRKTGPGRAFSIG